MSRIAGLFSSDALSHADAMISALSAGFQAVPEVSNRVEVRAGAVLLAASRRERNVAASVGDVTVFIDGQIYNRDALGGSGSDGHLVAELYRRYGFESTLTRLNGDFAIALHDRSNDTLWLARDRLGVKPLYYASTPNLFAFASRPRALLPLPGVGNGINRRFAAVFAASHYRYFDNRSEESPYSNVRQLPGGHWLKMRNGSHQTGRYWRLEDLPDWIGTEDALAEEYRALLLEAVAIRVKASRRPAFTLSGGMDSSSVLACATRFKQAPQEAISTVYSDKTYDESDEIQSMVGHSVAHWHRVVVDHPDVFATVRRMVDANDEPVATATWLSHFLLCERTAQQGFGGLFGGLGGDELNAGEYEYFFYHFADMKRCGDDAALNHEIERWAAHHDHPIHRKNAEVAEAMIARCTDRGHPGRCLPDATRMRRYYAALEPDFYDIENFVPIMETPFASYLKTRSYQDLSRETAPCCLRAEDRQTAAFGLDNYVPFFDHRLVEFMFRVPGTMKIRDGVTKVLLRNAMRGVLPEETRTRVKKTGWNAPAHLWFTGQGRAQLQDMIHSQAFRERGTYRVDEVQRLVKEHDDIVASGAMRENHMMFIWQMVNLETWLASTTA